MSTTKNFLFIINEINIKLGNFFRKKIVSVQCSCGSAAEWCCHLVALCLHRIHLADTVKLRAPVSESLTRLQRDDLQKFAQVNNQILC
jgi:hypothetical protein